jgi:hypothetical protein
MVIEMIGGSLDDFDREVEFQLGTAGARGNGTELSLPPDDRAGERSIARAIAHHKLQPYVHVGKNSGLGVVVVDNRRIPVQASNRSSGARCTLRVPSPVTGGAKCRVALIG